MAGSHPNEPRPLRPPNIPAHVRYEVELDKELDLEHGELTDCGRGDDKEDYSDEQGLGKRTSSTVISPLEKRPTEIQLMIFRLTIPEDRIVSLQSVTCNWNDDDQELHPRADIVPTALFRLNKSISADALALFHN
ncbi:MAG: hypothetical protein LQ343_002507 [Gyalolechia ehrenbergii]|nr:MAG: hypothetical protein LQ343_002507 [Gyalolechia ehrenbergii]